MRGSRGWLTLFTSLVLLLLTLECLLCVMILLYQPGIYLSLKKVLQTRLMQVQNLTET